jgi:hypothetical protein
MILRLTTAHEKAWIPAFAGMTTGGHPRGSGGPLAAATAIVMAARNLAPSLSKTMRDSSSSRSCGTPRNDRPNRFFRSLFGPKANIFESGLGDRDSMTARRGLRPQPNVFCVSECDVGTFHAGEAGLGVR